MIVVIIFEIETTIFLKDIHGESELLNDPGLKLIIKQSMLDDELPSLDSFIQPSVVLLNDPDLELDFLIIVPVIKF